MTVIVIILIHGMIATVISVELMIHCFMKQAVLMQDILLVMVVDVIPVVMAYQLLMEIALEMEKSGMLIPMPMVMIL